jgi:O-antigen ligase
VFYGKTDSMIMNGTGRLPVWDWLIRNQVSQRPLLGFGFGYGEVQARLFNEGIGALKMTHLHNAFMSALVNLGCVGTVLLFLFWGGILRATWKLRGFPLRPVMIAAVVATMLDSLTMESITAPLSYGGIGHLLVYVTAIRGLSMAQANSVRPMGFTVPQSMKGPRVVGR